SVVLSRRFRLLELCFLLVLSPRLPRLSLSLSLSSRLSNNPRESLICILQPCSSFSSTRSSSS
ncbi:hypothetical protein S245_066922, partial [Arachis hypogaea]